ncbi:MAG TPA: aminotransferase class I/II-fold pyridoxal phosphate-dependent enzyme [Caldilineaceae bacterium]|nr:aminotransferase class I/II-fold pyridoxal phosphate-dependent enzyme [Caldilineaceae bacterium]
MKIEAFALERWLTTHELNVKYDIAESGILPLKTSELLAFEPKEERETTLERLLNLPLGYNEAVGTKALRSAIAATYADCGPDQILVTTGAIEANFLLFNTLLEPGDHVVAIYPAYQQLYSVPKAIGCEVTLWPIQRDGGFHYDLALLEKLVTQRTRMIVINTPHNPTGAMLSPAELQRIYALAEAIGAWVLCDEAYRWIEVPGGKPFGPPMADFGKHGISVGTVSKPFGLPGLRLGWIAAPADVVAQCWAMRDYLSLSPGKLSDALALLAFKHREKIMARNRTIITTNLQSTTEWVAANAAFLSWQPPQGGLLALLHYELDLPSRELADQLATDYSVMLAPGSAFGYESHLRIGIGQHPTIFQAGLAGAQACFDALLA